MKILFFEDRGAVNIPIVDALERKGHRVFSAYNVNDATSYWEDEQPLDAIILDLSVDPTGLSDSQLEQTQEGLLTGWIWLRDTVLREHPEFGKRTCIYTEFRDVLIGAVPEEERRDIRVIGKREEEAPKQLIQAIGEIATRLGSVSAE